MRGRRLFVAAAAVLLTAGLTALVPAAPASAATTSYEAESSSNTLAGGASVATCSGCTGARKVGHVGNNSGTLQFNGVSASAAGTATVSIAFVNGATTSRSAQLSVYGVAATTISFATTADWSTVKARCPSSIPPVWSNGQHTAKH